MVKRCIIFFLIFLGVFFLSGCGVRLGLSRDFEREFNEIQDVFDSVRALPTAEQSAEFKRVAIMYQGLLDKGIRSGQLYYNQGNAWFYAGERGRAIAAYRLALRYLPRDAKIQANLRVASGGNINTVSEGADLSGGRVLIIEYLFFWQNWFGVHQKVFYSGLLSFFLFVVGLVVLFIRRVYYRFFRRFAIFLLVVTLISLISTAYDWYRFECFSYAVVSVEDAQPRKGNSDQYDKAFTRPVPLGTNATVIGDRGEWLHLRFGSMQEGWLPKSQVVVY
ncbi:MAG: tetratricopeptide repeat protein [Planctomycetaceae bacterium]|jgi:tetratricopeptide (TPR) repeat protein|nr:tetratricopeptide repeat protein [Planctomycetaceae bacterium]